LFRNLDFRKVLFIDNHIFSFAANLQNGILVVDFLGNKKDIELLKVTNYALNISCEKNLMKKNEQIFGFQRIKNSDIQSFIKYYKID
jgi:NLI interacting factor-like phosphatase